MTIINPDHEAAIAAFHRAAARAGTGGDGRYARVVAFLEPSVRRELEAAAPQPPVEAQAQGGGEAVPVAWRTRHRDVDWSFTTRPHPGDIARGIWQPLYTAPPSAPVGVEGVLAEIRAAADAGGATEGKCYGWWRALAQQPAAEFRNDGNSEADFIAHHADACTACGGSGHKADQQPAAVDEAMPALVELVATLAATGTVTGGRIYFPERQTRELLKRACDTLATQHQEPTTQGKKHDGPCWRNSHADCGC